MLKTTIEKDFITAFKAKDAVKKNTLGILKTAITNSEKAAPGKEITDEVIFGIIASEIKKRNQTLDLISGKDMTETVTILNTEIEVLNSYLPAQMTDEEMTIEINKIVLTIPAGQNAMGVVMKHFNTNFKGKYDNKRLKDLIENK